MAIRIREFHVPPPTHGDLVIHFAGTILNTALAFWGIYWVVTNWNEASPSWPILVIAVFAGLFLGDFISGFLHWGFDTWFDEDMTSFARVAIIVREHHIYPQNIFRYRFRDESGPISIASLLFTGPVYAFVTLGDGPPSAGGVAAIIVCLIVSVCMALMLQCHKLGHKRTKSKVLQFLQQSHLLMHPRHHCQHHRDNHDIRYCLINGWADQVMDRVKFWRGLEWLIQRTTGAVPRRNDHEWMDRYGRRY